MMHYLIQGIKADSSKAKIGVPVFVRPLRIFWIIDMDDFLALQADNLIKII